MIIGVIFTRSPDQGHRKFPLRHGDIMGAKVTRQPLAYGFGTPAAKSFGSNYQAATDGIVTASASLASQNLVVSGYTDATATPSTVVAQNSCISSSGGDTRQASVTFLVKKGNYYRVDYNISPTSSVMSFTPFGQI